MSIFYEMLSNIIISEDVSTDTVFILSPRYKTVQDGTGEPPRFKEVLDLEATAKASVVIYNVGSEN